MVVLKVYTSLEEAWYGQRYPQILYERKEQVLLGILPIRLGVLYIFLMDFEDGATRSITEEHSVGRAAYINDIDGLCYVKGIVKSRRIVIGGGISIFDDI